MALILAKAIATKFVQLNEVQNSPIDHLILEFTTLKAHNIKQLKSLKITKNNLSTIGTHPDFGNVTLQQLIATWAVHALSHIGQISRVMAKQYTKEVGPRIDFLEILKK